MRPSNCAGRARLLVRLDTISTTCCLECGGRRSFGNRMCAWPFQGVTQKAEIACPILAYLFRDAWTRPACRARPERPAPCVTIRSSREPGAKAAITGRYGSLTVISLAGLLRIRVIEFKPLLSPIIAAISLAVVATGESGRVPSSGERVVLIVAMTCAEPREISHLVSLHRLRELDLLWFRQ